MEARWAGRDAPRGKMEASALCPPASGHTAVEGHMWGTRDECLGDVSMWVLGKLAGVPVS